MDAIARRVTGLASEVHELQRRRRVAQRESSDVSGIDVELAHLTEELGEAMEMLVFA